MVAYRRQRVEGLKAPMLEVITRFPGSDHRAVLTILKQEKRITVGVQLGEGLDACLALQNDGLIQGGPYMGWRTVVPPETYAKGR